MNDYRYILEKGSRKFICPAPGCGKKSFVRYIDTETGEYLPEQYGRCDRESKCSYHLNPYLDGYAKAIREQEQGNRSEIPNNWKPQRKSIKPQSTPSPVYFDFDTFKQTLNPTRYEKNVFIQNLLSRIAFPFETATIEKVISLYYLGTVSTGYRAGAITFPFIDKAGNVRTIQVKEFNEANHTTATDFLHSIIEKYYTRNNKPLPEWLEAYTKQDKRVSCLFGEHLLSKYPFNPIALVEAPKTAVYGTLYFGLPESPETLIWLAVYNKSSFSFDKLKVLKGRDVFTFPDLSKDGNTFKEWETKAKDYENRLPGTRFIFSDLLEQLAPNTDKTNGNDLADYLIKQDWQLFRRRVIQEQPEPQHKRVHLETEKCEKCEPLKKTFFSHVEPLPKVEVFKTERESWTNEINELEAFFNGIELPPDPVKPNPWTKIVDARLFIENNLATVKANNGKRTFLPYLKQLQSFRTICLSKKNDTKKDSTENLKK